jgi:hypothetical protein
MPLASAVTAAPTTGYRHEPSVRLSAMDRCGVEHRLRLALT